MFPSLRFIYETEKFNGIGELLEILGRYILYRICVLCIKCTIMMMCTYVWIGVELKLHTHTHVLS